MTWSFSSARKGLAWALARSVPPPATLCGPLSRTWPWPRRWRRWAKCAACNLSLACLAGGCAASVHLPACPAPASAPSWQSAVFAHATLAIRSPHLQCGIADAALRDGRTAQACARLQEALHLLADAPQAGGAGLLPRMGGGGGAGGQPHALAPRLQAEIQAALARYHPDAVADYLQVGCCCAGCAVVCKCVCEGCGDDSGFSPCVMEGGLHSGCLQQAQATLGRKRSHHPSTLPGLPQHPNTPFTPPRSLPAQMPYDRTNGELRERQVAVLREWARGRGGSRSGAEPRPTLTPGYMSRVVPCLTAGDRVSPCSANPNSRCCLCGSQAACSSSACLLAAAVGGCKVVGSLACDQDSMPRPKHPPPFVPAAELCSLYDWGWLATGGSSARCPWYFPGLLKVRRRRSF